MVSEGHNDFFDQSFIEAVGAEDVVDLPEGLTLQRYRAGAESAPFFRAADNGDIVAIGILRWAGEQLAELEKGGVR